MAISGQILERGGQVRTAEVNLASVGDADCDVGDREHGRVGEAAGQRDHLLGGRRQDPRHLPDQRGLTAGGDLVYEPRVNHFHFKSLLI